jgi:hypothetical protein
MSQDGKKMRKKKVKKQVIGNTQTGVLGPDQMTVRRQEIGKMIKRSF